MLPDKIDPMPRSIVEAICRVQASLDAVKKSQRNTHGGYNFASTDDIYAAVTRKLGEVGLVIYPIEMHPHERQMVKVGTGANEKTQTILSFHFGYVLATSADTWFDPRSSRGIDILHTGPQSYIAAESYCQKAYLRALLKLPTGDMDLDSMPQAETLEDQGEMVGNGTRKPRKSSAEGKRDGSVKRFNSLVAEIRNAVDEEDLESIAAEHYEDGRRWADMPPQWAVTLDEECEGRRRDFADMEALRGNGHAS